jgi:hypothetical protein
VKRDLDLVRKLLIYFNDKPDDSMENAPNNPLAINGYSDNLVSYHLLIMDEAGLLRCERSVSSTTEGRLIRVYPFSLTWAGHEFLSAAIDETTWNKAKGVSLEKAGVLSFEIIKDLLILMAKDKLGMSQG